MPEPPVLFRVLRPPVDPTVVELVVAFTKFWWSNPASAVLTAPGIGSVTAMVDPAQWSDWNGQGGTTDVAAFNDAASTPDLIGLSFGSGCFFENGVGIDGSATFKLMSWTIN